MLNTDNNTIVLKSLMHERKHERHRADVKAKKTFLQLGKLTEDIDRVAIEHSDCYRLKYCQNIEQFFFSP